MSVPVCTQSGFDNYYNSLGQSPCYIATALGNACNMPGNAALTLPPLTDSQPIYPGPSVANANNLCQCNTVYYSLLSACSICQTLSTSSWAYHSQNCISTALSFFPRPIPAGTSVPHYAYLPIDAGGFFSENDTLSVGGAESSPIPSATSTAFNSSKGIKIGAAVEGVVGFLVLLIILGLIWFCKFRRGHGTSGHRYPSEPDALIRPQPLLRRKSTDW